MLYISPPKTALEFSGQSATAFVLYIYINICIQIYAPFLLTENPANVQKNRKAKTFYRKQSTEVSEHQKCDSVATTLWR